MIDQKTPYHRLSCGALYSGPFSVVIKGEV